MFRCSTRRAARSIAIALSITASCCCFTPTASAVNTVIGNWESGTPEGWIDWGNGQAPIAAPRFAFNGIGATNGTRAIQFNLPGGGYTQWAAFKLQLANNGIAEYRPDFMAADKLLFDLTLVQSDMTVAAGNDFASLDPIVNADGYGFLGQGNPESVTGNGDGFISANHFNPQLLQGTRTFTWTYDIAHLHDGNAANGEIVANPNYIELIFETFSNGGVAYHIDNVRLVSVPEPASLATCAIAAAGAIGATRRRRPR